jgi:hypothetical protein
MLVLNEDALPNTGAIVNIAQQRLMAEMFGLHAWTYVHSNPFEMKKKLDDQEKRLKDVGVK